MSLTVLSESGSVRILTGVHCSQLVPTSGGVRVELCSQSLSSSPSTGTFGCYGYGGWTEGSSSRATLGSTVNTCTASASWGFWKNFPFFYVKVFSGSEVDSRPALLESSFELN